MGAFFVGSEWTIAAPDISAGQLPGLGAVFCRANLMSMSKALEALSRMKATVARKREEIEAITGRTINGATTVAAGAALGMAIHKFGENGRLTVPGTDVDAGLAGGVVLMGIGIAGMGGRYSDVLASAGAGLLAGQLAISTFQDGKLMG